MSKTNVQIVEEYIEEVYNHKHFDRIFEYCTENCVFHLPPYVGLGLDSYVHSNNKIVLFNIMPNGPAGGVLREGDELVRVTDGGKTWETFEDLKNGLWAGGAFGTHITFTVDRAGKLMEVPLKRSRIDGYDQILSAHLDIWRKFMLKVWPDRKVEIRLIFGDGDLICCYTVNSGKNQEFLRSAIWSEITIYRLTDRKIVEMWGVEDLFSQMKQLGYQIHPPGMEQAA